MSRWGYQSNRRDRYELAEKNGIAVDRARGILTLTATWAGWPERPPVVQEYPLLLVRECGDCGRAVTVYALGSLDGLCLATGRTDLFDQPWRGWGTWKLIDQGGAFALVRARHKPKGEASHLDCPQTNLEVKSQPGSTPPRSDS